MIIGEPLGLLALTGLPAIVALHLWRARHAPLPVSGLFLWPADRRVLASGRRRAPLVLRPSFWCEILAVLLAAWWLADVHWSPRTTARHLVIVLDDRWRLQAASNGVSAAERLRTAIDQRLAGLAGGDRATLIATGAPPRLLAGPAAEPAAVRTALAAWQPLSAWHDPDAALTLAAGIGGPGAEVVFGSDRIPLLLPDGVGAIATGRRAATSGLSDVHWWRQGGERIVVLTYGDAARIPQLRIGGVVVTGSSPQPGLHVFDHLPPMAEEAAAEVRLEGPDALTLDDHVELVRPPPRLVRMRVALDGAGGDAVRAAARAVGAQVDDGPADIAVGADGGAGCWSLRFAPGDGAPSLGPFTARRDHPLMADLDFDGVLWTGSVALEQPGAPLLIGSGRLLISATSRGADQDISLHLDLARSNLARHTAWPALFANLVAWWSSALPGIADPNPRAGQPVAVRLPADAGPAELVDPSGQARALRPGADGSVQVPGLALPGSWHVRWRTADRLVRVLPLDPRQGDLDAAATAERPAVASGRSQVERQRSPLAGLLPLVALAVAAMLAWIAFRREERP